MAVRQGVGYRIASLRASDENGVKFVWQLLGKLEGEPRTLFGLLEAMRGNLCVSALYWKEEAALQFCKYEVEAYRRPTNVQDDDLHPENIVSVTPSLPLMHYGSEYEAPTCPKSNNMTKGRPKGR